MISCKKKGEGEKEFTEVGLAAVSRNPTKEAFRVRSVVKEQGWKNYSRPTGMTLMTIISCSPQNASRS